MPLTIPEKEHWLERLRRLLDRKIAALRATDPTRRRRLNTQARQRAWQALGLAPLQAELEALGAQRKDLRRRVRQVHRAMPAIVCRKPLQRCPRRAPAACRMRWPRPCGSARPPTPRSC